MVYTEEFIRFKECVNTQRFAITHSSPNSLFVQDYIKKNNLFINKIKNNIADHITTKADSSLAARFTNALINTQPDDSIDKKMTDVTRFPCYYNGKLLFRYVGFRQGKLKYLKEKIGKHLVKLGGFDDIELSILTDAIRSALTIDVGVYSGRDILQLYDEDNMKYYTCMRGRYDALELYTHDPDMVKCLYAVDDAGSYVFKAFIWRVDKDTWIMDNPYYDDGERHNTIKNLADDGYIEVEGHKICINRYKYRCITRLMPGYLDEYPYVDDFARLLYIDNEGYHYMTNDDSVSEYIYRHDDCYEPVVLREDPTTSYEYIEDKLIYSNNLTDDMFFAILEMLRLRNKHFAGMGDNKYIHMPFMDSDKIGLKDKELACYE